MVDKWWVRKGGATRRMPRGSRMDAVIKVGSLAELLTLLLGVQMASGHITESEVDL